MGNNNNNNKSLVSTIEKYNSVSAAKEVLSPYDQVLGFTMRLKNPNTGEIENKIIPLYSFIEEHLYITDKSSNVRKMKLNAAQIDLYIDMCKMKQNNKPIRVNILKARQLGMSTFIAAVIFVETIFRPNRKALIIADVAEHAINLFDKYVFFYDHLPEAIKQKIPRIVSNKRELVVQHKKGFKSSIRITVPGDGAGRSGTFDFLHLSECAFWQDLQKTLTSIFQTVSTDNKESMIFLETTGNGFNEYKQRWDTDVASMTAKNNKEITDEDGSPFQAKFYGWYWDLNYQKPYSGFKLMPHEEKIKRELGLKDEQLAWYRMQYNYMNQNLDDLKQEYPSTPIEAFKSTGVSVFNMDLIAKRKEELIANDPVVRRGYFSYRAMHSQDGRVITLSDYQFIPVSNGALKIFEEPKPGHPYVINCDPSNGGNDFTAIQVLDNYTGKQVACYNKKKVADDEVAYTMVILGKLYNEALISTETNVNTYILWICDKCGYRNIYQDVNTDTLSQRYQDRFGYKTTVTNRSMMISLFKEAFRDNYKFINDYETLTEMEGFQYYKAGNKLKEMGANDNHDDLVMAMCGIFLIRNQQRATIDVNKPIANVSEWKKYFTPSREEEKRNKLRKVYQIWD